MSGLATVAERLESLRQWHHFDATGPSGVRLRRGAPSFSAWLRGKGREHVGRLLDNRDERATEHLRRDYREWRRDWIPGDPIMIGSGRRADWCHISYLRYALIARLLHERLGWSGQRVRDAAHAIARCTMDGWRWQPPATPLPTRELMAIASLPAGYYDEGILQRERQPAREQGSTPDDELAVRGAGWLLWHARVAAPAWGRFVFCAEMARLWRNPEAKTPSMIVGEVLRLRGQGGTDFRFCSGCEYLGVVEAYPQHHDYLLSRAAEPQRVTLASGLEAVVVPFGLPAPAEFDHCLVLELNREIRVRSADWAALGPEAVFSVVAGGGR